MVQAVHNGKKSSSEYVISEQSWTEFINTELRTVTVSLGQNYLVPTKTKKPVTAVLLPRRPRTGSIYSLPVNIQSD